MKASELRIGNLIYEKRPLDLDYRITDVRYIANDLAIEFIEPIPLTEEWLLKFGFEKDGDSFIYGNGWLIVDFPTVHYSFDIWTFNENYPTTSDWTEIPKFGGDTLLLEKARVELINSFIKPNENRSQGQIDAYTIAAKGIKVHNESGDIYIFGLRVNKSVVEQGVYPIVNSKPLTLAKNTLRRELKSNKFTQYKINATTAIKLNGEELVFE